MSSVRLWLEYKLLLVSYLCFFDNTLEVISIKYTEKSGMKYECIILGFDYESNSKNAD